MTYLLGTLVVAFVSALFPLVNAEAYVGALAATVDGASVWAVAAAAGVGQMMGKLIYFQVGRSSLRWKWVRRKTESAKWQDRLAGLQRRAAGSRVYVTGFLALSAFTGLPPFAIVSVLAGQLRVPLVLFCVTGLLGRTLRFAAIMGGVAALV